MLLITLPFPSLFQLAYLSAACIGGYWCYWELTTGRRRRQLARKHGCMPPKRIKTIEPFLGLDLFYTTTKWTLQHTLLENMDKLLFSSGPQTAKLNTFGSDTLFTAEAENIKTVLSLDFKSFGLPDKPKELDLLLGEGIFTSEGQAWHQSRELLRPCFARAQVADLDMLEKHASALIQAVPRNGSMIDLSKSFSNFTLSVAIDFLFGNNAAKGNSDVAIRSNDAFAEVWNRLSGYLAGEGQNAKSMILRLILDRVGISPSQYKRDCLMIHGRLFCILSTSASTERSHLLVFSDTWATEYVDDLVEKSLSAMEHTKSSTSTGRQHYLFLPELVSQTKDKIKIRTEALTLPSTGRMGPPQL